MTIYSGFSHYNWPFSTAMINYRRIDFCMFIPCVKTFKRPKMVPAEEEHVRKAINDSLTVREMTGTFSSWWFGTFFMFPYIGSNHPN